MLLTELAPAAQNPVPLREFGAHLRLSHGFADDGAEDAVLELYLRNAAAVIETRLCQALIRRAFVLKIAHWNRRGHMVLPIGPVETVDSVRFVRPGSEINLDPAEWFLTPGATRQTLSGPGGCALRPLPHGAQAEIAFSAGYGDSWNNVPDDLRQAVLLLASHFYETRSAGEQDGVGLPGAVTSLVEPHRALRV